MGLDTGHVARMVGYIPVRYTHHSPRAIKRGGYPRKSRFGEQFHSIRTAVHRADCSIYIHCIQERRKTEMAVGSAKRHINYYISFVHMEKLRFTTIINASREKVWDTMLNKDTYMEWTVPFHEGCTYDGNWEKGSEMKFIGPTEDGSISGMYAVIVANRPHEFLSIQHLGEFKDDERNPWPLVEGQEGFENYTFKDIGTAGTEVLVELTVPAEWKDMFNDMWPRALATLKEIAEK